MYLVVINGIEIRCETPEDVAQLAEVAGRLRLTGPPPPSEFSRKPAASGRTAGHPRNLHGDLVRATGMLREIQSAPDKRALVKTIVNSLGLRATPAIGPVVSLLRRELKQHGFRFDQVAVRRRDDEGRSWIAGPRLNEAIEALESARRTTKGRSNRD